MKASGILTGAAIVALFAASSAYAQQQTQRLRGTIERADGNTLFVKGPDGIYGNPTQGRLTFEVKGNAGATEPLLSFLAANWRRLKPIWLDSNRNALHSKAA